MNRKQIARTVGVTEKIPTNSMKLVKVNSGDHDVEVILINEDVAYKSLIPEMSVNVIRNRKNTAQTNY